MLCPSGAGNLMIRTSVCFSDAGKLAVGTNVYASDASNLVVSRLVIQRTHRCKLVCSSDAGELVM